MEKETYNGWKNRQTWNVALWINNDEGLYTLAKDCENYSDFMELMRDVSDTGTAYETPDNVAWNDSGLDFKRLDELIKEIN